jgi:hypothetical protein
VRLQGVQRQGLRAPAGAAPIPLDAGYNAIPSRDPAERDATAALVLALLFPDRALGTPTAWCQRGSSAPSRAALALGAAGRSYRVIVDFARSRVGLARIEREGAQERVSTDADGVAAALRELGLPAFDDYLALAWIGGRVPRPPAPDEPEVEVAEAAAGGTTVDTLVETLGGSFVRSAPTPAPSEPDSTRAAGLARVQAELAVAERVAQQRRELLARRERLEQARATLVAQEHELKACQSELEQLAPLAEGIEEFDERIRRYRGLVEARDGEREALDRARHELLDDRGRLRVVPPAQRAWIALGLLLGVCGAASGAVVHPGFAALGLAGVALASVALWISRSAQRRVGGIEARLAALRVRERAIERHFEAEGAAVRALLRALGLDGADALEAAAARFRECLVRAETLRGALETARRAFPEGTEAELAELGTRLDELPESDVSALRRRLLELAPPPPPEPPTVAEPMPPAPAPSLDAAPQPAPPSEEETQPEVGDAIDADALDAALAAAARWLGRGLGEIEAAVAPTFPVYLRSLTRGTLVAAERRGGQWLVRADPREQPRPFESVSPALRQRALIALRLALLERLAPSRPIPVLALASGLALDDEGSAALGRALRRLSAVTQIVHFT